MQKERQRIFREVTKQYQDEGYDLKESRRMARHDPDDIMADTETFIDYYMSEVWEDADE